MATKSMLQKWNRKLAEHQKAIMKERNSLAHTIQECESLKSDCDEAWDALDTAREALRRMV